MLSDPITITYSSVSKSLPRAHAHRAGTPRKLGEQTYRVADGEFALTIGQFEYRDGHRRSEVILGKLVTDSDSGTLAAGQYATQFGVILGTDPYRVGISEIANVRAALLDFLTPAVELRIRNGES